MKLVARIAERSWYKISEIAISRLDLGCSLAGSAHGSNGSTGGLVSRGGGGASRAAEGAQGAAQGAAEIAARAHAGWGARRRRRVLKLQREH